MNEKILIVEDRVDSLEMVKTSLENIEYTVFGEENGEKALKFLEKQDVDLIILDLMLPGMSGLQVLEKIRENRKYDKIKIIVFSAAKLTKKQKDAFTKFGADIFLPKPIPVDKLREEVQKLLG